MPQDQVRSPLSVDATLAATEEMIRWSPNDSISWTQNSGPSIRRVTSTTRSMKRGGGIPADN